MLGSTISEGAERWLGMQDGELGRDLSVATSENGRELCSNIGSEHRNCLKEHVAVSGGDT